MGIYIRPKNIISKVNIMNTNVVNARHEASLVFESLDKVNRSENELQGMAWDNARKYISSVQLPLLRMYITCLDLEKEANDKYCAAAGTLPNVDVLDEELLIETRDKYDRRLDIEYSRRHPRNSVINFYLKRIKYCDSMLEEIYSFCDETQNIYLEAGALAETLFRLNSQLKLIKLDSVTHTFVMPKNMPEVELAMEEAGRFYAQVREKEFKDRLAELETMLAEHGAEYTIRQILNQPVEENLNSDIESVEYGLIAGLMIGSQDYIPLLNTVLYNSYEVGEVNETGQGYFNTVNVVYSKTDKLVYIYNALLEAGSWLNHVAENTVGEDKELLNERMNMMQLVQLFGTLNEYEGHPVVSTLYSRQADLNTKQTRGEKLIEAEKDENGSIKVTFLRYSGVAGAGPAMPYDTHSNAVITVTAPTQSQTGEDNVDDIAMSYIYHGYGLDKSPEQRLLSSIESREYAKLLGKLNPPLAKGYAAVRLVEGYFSDIRKENTFKAAKEIIGLGTTIDIFNLSVVSSIISENNGEVDKYSAGLFPTYKMDHMRGKSTRECIENFNSSFSAGGEYHQYAEYIGYDEKNPITEENFNDRLEEIKEMVKEWKTRTSKAFIDSADIAE